MKGPPGPSFAEPTKLENFVFDTFVPGVGLAALIFNLSSPN